MLWLLRWRQVPGVFGTTGGRWPPRALATGLENVSVMGVCGRSLDPGAGEATADVAAPAGNQLTKCARVASQLSGTPRIQIEPAWLERWRVTTRVGAESTCLTSFLADGP